MKAKKLLAILLCLCLLVSAFAGCGGNGSEDSGNESQTSQSSETDSSTGEETEVSAENFDPAELTMLMVSPMPNEEGYNRVAEAMSEITQEKFNVTMNITGVAISNYTNKMNLMLASGDPLDIFQGFFMYNQFVSMGYMLNLDPYEDLYQDALEVVGDLDKQCFYNGSRYGLPNSNNGAVGGDAYAFRKDIIDAIGVDLTDYASLEDLEEVLVKIKEAYPDITPIMGGGTNAPVRSQGDPFTGTFYDGLGNNFVCVDPHDSEGTVQITVEMDYWKHMADLAWDWSQKGLVGYDELATDVDNMKGGRSAAMFIGNGPAAKSEAETQTGFEVVLWEPQDDRKALITTNNAWTWSITEYTEHPEQAILVLNELYVDPDLSNLLVWGIKDEDYVVVDEENKLVDFPEGLDQNSVGYYNLIKDQVPNLYICYQGVYEEPNKYQAYQNWRKERMEISPYLGFVSDQNAYASEATACQNVLDQYQVALHSGQLDPSTAYDEMIEKLDAAGIETIREEIQKQLDAWVAENEQ